MERLDRVYSQYIRLKDADMSGYVRCYCCGVSIFWKEAQNGHYMNRRYTNTRFFDENCKPCCYDCNINLNGNLKEYEKHLVKDYGEEITYTLRIMASTYMKYSKNELEGLIRHYRKEVKRLKKEKGL